MIPLLQCQLCHSKILENRVQKHHAKVHANIDRDIYTPLTDVAPHATGAAHNIDTKASEIPTVWADQITPTAADDQMVHVSCTICGNRMPTESLDQHMKRKHNDEMKNHDGGDQVDAVGTKVNSMAADSEKANAATVDTPKYLKKQLQEQAVNWKMPASWPSSKYPFQFTANPKIDASTMVDEQAFYTIRVSVEQMKQLMKENRIDPKEGHFYLK